MLVYWNYPKLIDQYLNKVCLGGLDWQNPKFMSQYLNMVCPGWLGLANPMGNEYCYANYLQTVRLSCAMGSSNWLKPLVSIIVSIIKIWYTLNGLDWLILWVIIILFSIVLQ